jgi:D-tagatose-bisphosphate aldolase class II non-catalytic subunit
MRVDLFSLAANRRAGTVQGITSVCSAHPIVLRAALRFAAQHQSTVLIEATCNQVNHLGGYTGLQPADFAALVHRIAAEEACPPDLVLLGGDHLGPNPWRDRPVDQAMAEAKTMVVAYVAAGFRKLHLDASMGCRGEPESLDDQTTATRAAQLAAVAEATAARLGLPPPVYVIGTEVPPPGGADHSLTTIPPTLAEAARKTIAVHRRVFAEAGQSDAFARTIALVVQPGVEFGNHNVIPYDPSRSTHLTALLTEEPQFVYEAHSTDYQGRLPLTHLVRDGFQILKVGPELTFVLREALYGLDLIASDLIPGYGNRPLMQAMEALMLSDPAHWQRHYPADQPMLIHYSLSDRIRYYWAHPGASNAVDRLLRTLTGRRIPVPLLSQHLPAAAHFADQPLDPNALLIWRVTRSLETYHRAGLPRPDPIGGA